MKHSQAANTIRELLPAIQKFKSNATEALEQFEKPSKVNHEVLKELFPWVFSEQKNILPAIIKLNERLDNGGMIEPIEFFNVMFIFHRFDPSVKQALLLAEGFNIWWGIKLPDPDASIIVHGWEPEE